MAEEEEAMQHPGSHEDLGDNCFAMQGAINHSATGSIAGAALLQKAPDQDARQAEGDAGNVSVQQLRSASATVRPTDSSGAEHFDLETARANSTDWASSSRESSRIWQALAWIFGYYMAAAVVGVLPRSIALVISSTVPQVGTKEAMDSFRDLWAPCKTPGAAFSAFSPDGQFYKTLVGSDIMLGALGAVCSVLPIAHVTFVPAKHNRVGRLLVRGSHVVQFVLAAVSCVISLALLHGAPTMATLKFLDEGRTIYQLTGISFFGVTYVLNGLVTRRDPDDALGAQPRAAVTGSATRVYLGSATGRRFVSKVGGILLLGLALLFGIQLGTLQQMIYDLVGFRSLVGIYLPVVASKTILLCIRKSHRIDEFVGQPKTITMLSFWLNVTTSTAVRRCIASVA